MVVSHAYINLIWTFHFGVRVWKLSVESNVFVKSPMVLI